MSCPACCFELRLIYFSGLSLSLSLSLHLSLSLFLSLPLSTPLSISLFLSLALLQRKSAHNCSCARKHCPGKRKKKGCFTVSGKGCLKLREGKNSCRPVYLHDVGLKRKLAVLPIAGDTPVPPFHRRLRVKAHHVSPVPLNNQGRLFPGLFAETRKIHRGWENLAFDRSLVGAWYVTTVLCL